METPKQANYFTALNKIECATEKKNNLTYVSWSDAWTKVKEQHPDATYTIYENADGFPFWESKFGIDCKVGVTINGIEHIVRLPVMDGANNAQTDARQEIEKERFVYRDKQKVWDKENNCYLKEKYTLIIEPANAFDINKTIQRAFAKAIAMHGIGLYVYRGEDLPDEIDGNNAPISHDVHQIPSKTTKPYITSQIITMKIQDVKEGKIQVSSADSLIELLRRDYIVARDWAEKEIRAKYDAVDKSKQI